jgi:hypothetical protein
VDAPFANVTTMDGGVQAQVVASPPPVETASSPPPSPPPAPSPPPPSPPPSFVQQVSFRTSFATLSLDALNDLVYRAKFEDDYKTTVAGVAAVEKEQVRQQRQERDWNGNTV